MTVYVDDFGMPAEVGRTRGRWSHLVSDEREELHAFAALLGLRREWFQDPVINGKPLALPGTRGAEHYHYDVTESKRRRAIQLGAQPISYRALPQIIDARWARTQAAAADRHEQGEEG